MPLAVTHFRYMVHSPSLKASVLEVDEDYI
jgi:hypothetical protein